MAICQLCGFLPAVGECPRCQRSYCPDDVQQEHPFLLCYDCIKEDPIFLQNEGEWLDSIRWLDYRTHEIYKIVSDDRGHPFSNTRDIWIWLTNVYQKEENINLWEMCEKVSISNKNPIGAALCRLRRIECYTPHEAMEKATKIADEGNPERALEIIEDTLLTSPDNPNPLILRGDMYRGMNKFQDAINDFSQAIKLAPDQPQGYFSRAMAYFFDSKEYDHALKDLKIIEQIDERNKNNLVVRYMLGTIYARRRIIFGDQKAGKLALEYLNSDIEKYPEFVLVFPTRGYVRLLSGNETAAIEDFNRAMESLKFNIFDMNWLFEENTLAGEPFKP